MASGSQKTAETVGALISSSCTDATEPHPEIRYAASGGEARRTVLHTEFDLILINAPLSDEYGSDLAAALTTSTTASVLLLVPAAMAEALLYRMESCGVIVVEKPIVRQIFTTVLRLAMTCRHRLLAVKQDNVRLQQKIEELRLIDRAKCVLIQYLNMTESQAHRYIEKQAMDLRTAKTEIAEGILHTYGEQKGSIGI